MRGRITNDFDFPMEKFHAKTLLKKRDHYPMLERLAKVISKLPKVHSISYGIVISDFNSLTLEQRKFMTGALISLDGEYKSTGCPNKPYFVPFQNIVKLLTG